MWTILKVFTEFVMILLLFYILDFGCEACGILAPRPGIEPTPPALKGEVLATGPPDKSHEFSDKQGKEQKHFHFSSLIGETSVIKVLDTRMALFSVARNSFLRLFISPFIYLPFCILSLFLKPCIIYSVKSYLFPELYIENYKSIAITLIGCLSLERQVTDTELSLILTIILKDSCYFTLFTDDESETKRS